MEQENNLTNRKLVSLWHIGRNAGKEYAGRSAITLGLLVLAYLGYTNTRENGSQRALPMITAATSAQLYEEEPIGSSATEGMPLLPEGETPGRVQFGD